MRTFFAQVETRYRAIKNCPFTPARVVKVFSGYVRMIIEFGKTKSK